MKRLAFITGGAGFLGAHLCSVLLENNFQVICFGRSNFASLNRFTRKLINDAEYHAIDLRKELKRVHEIIAQNLTMRCEELYFFNLAWSGEERLSDLSISHQFSNIPFTNELYRLSKNFDFDCFIHSGTMEEKFAQRYTKLDYKVDDLYNRHVVYALAKLYSRYCLTLDKASKTNLVINSNAHLIGPGDKKDSFLQQVIISHLNEQDIYMSSGEQLFDVINVQDCARAYLLTARKSSGLDEFWIGSGAPRKLIEYVNDINLYFDQNVRIHRNATPFNDVILDYEDFDAKKLYQLGFEPKYSFNKSIEELSKYLLK